MTLDNKRKSGILCHITSLPGKYGSGDLGKNAYYFIDFLKNNHQSYWQILPINHVGMSASPYQSHSAFAGNPYLIDIDDLIERKLINKTDISDMPVFNNKKINFNIFFPWKMRILKKAINNFIAMGCTEKNDFITFEKKEAFWLNDYALFMALKDAYKGAPWNKWDTEIANRDKKTIADVKKELYTEILEYKIIQFIFFSEWKKLKEYANKNNIQIIGDLPIFIDFDSDSLWCNPHLFLLDRNAPAYVAGVPPDYFCEDGQYWGNPLYNWNIMKEDDYDWWIKRLKHTFSMVDIVRLDHFRAFAAAWKIKANKEYSAKKGTWQPGPGKVFFDTVNKKLKNPHIIAEDLGMIDKKVTDLRDACNLPGMCVLQFAFDDDNSLFLPHNQIKNQVIYVGTHDNDTTIGWWEKLDEKTKDFTRRYLSINGNCINWEMMRIAGMSVADTAIYTMQDIIGLDSSSRMNSPGIATGNWGWRFEWSQINEWHSNMLKEITFLYKRS